VLLFLLRLLFGCHWFYSPFHSSWKICNGALLQLVDCIESMKSEVKKKMIDQTHAMLYESHSERTLIVKKFHDDDHRAI